MHRFVKWREALQLAPNVAAVNRIIDDYVRVLEPVVGTLPEECQRVLAAPLDVQTAAVTFLHAELRFGGSEEVCGLMHEIAHTFASAAVRVTLLHSAPTASVD